MARAADELDDLDLEEDYDVEEDEEEKAKPKGKGKKAEPKGVGAREMAESLGAEPKTFRAWLRRKVEAGDIELDHDHKQRYNFGASLNSPLAKRVAKLWSEDTHERGAGLEKAREARAKKGSSGAKKGSGAKKKATAKKKSSS